MYVKKKMQQQITIGDNIAFTSDESKNLTLSFCPVDILSCGEKSDRLARLIADYYQLYCDSRCATVIAMVLNELIENAVKYANKKNDSVTIDTLRNDDRLLIKITNTLSAHRLDSFIEDCQNLFREDLKTLFVNRIENLRKRNSGETSGGIGLILLKKDYNTGIKFIFYKNDRDHYLVSVIAELALE
jgi:hypothetical protein